MSARVPLTSLGQANLPPCSRRPAGYTAMPLVRGVDETSGPYFDPDPDTNIDRYSFTHQLSVRAKF